MSRIFAKNTSRIRIGIIFQFTGPAPRLLSALSPSPRRGCSLEVLAGVRGEGRVRDDTKERERHEEYEEEEEG